MGYRQALRQHHWKRGGVYALVVVLLLVMLNLRPASLQAIPPASMPTPISDGDTPPILYTFDLRDAFLNHTAPGPIIVAGEDGPPDGKTYTDLLYDYDLTLFVATLQGIVNRQGPRLYLYHAEGVDDFWLETFRAPGEWLEQYTLVEIPDLETLLETFQEEVTGTVVWDDALPATLNVATTIAGVEGTPVVRRGSALYEQITRRMPVRVDLSGRFSSKAEAYRWAMQEYLDRGRSNPRLLAYIEDGWPAVLYQRGVLTRGATSVFSRDYVVQNRGFVFDLSPWADETPVDEPDQPLGQDRAVFEEILSAARAQAGQDMIAIWGFVPWWEKYSNSEGSGGSHEPVEGEWEAAWLASSYGAFFTGSLGDVYGLDMANASLHRFAPFPERVPRPAAPTPEELIAQGLLQDGRVAPKTYLLFYMGDYDLAQPLYALMPELWNDPARGEIPLAWGVNPQTVEILPDILSYLLRTRSPADYFVAANSGAGYLNPEALPRDLWGSWREHNRSYYNRLGLSVTGFFLNGKGGEVPAEVMDLYQDFSPDGILVNWHHLVGPSPRLQDNMPLTVFPYYGLSNADDSATWIERFDQAYEEYRQSHGPDEPVFIPFRCAFVSPSFLVALVEELRRLHPERDYEVVDPYTFFYLMRRHLGGWNEYRATFLQEIFPQEMETGETYAVQLGVRNDGWETWPAEEVGLGFTFAERALAGEAPGAFGEALFLPLFEEVAPGQVYTFTFLLGAPLRPGEYVVQYDLLKTPWRWFHQEGNRWQEETLRVKEPAGGMVQEPPSLPSWPTPAPVGDWTPTPQVTVQGVAPAQATATLTGTAEPPPTLTATLPSGWDLPPVLETALAGRAVWAIARDAQGQVWLGGEEGIVLYRPNDDLTTADDVWGLYTVETGLPHPWVAALAADARGGMWVGTQGGGVAYVDDQGWTTYTEEDGLISNWVRDIAIDPLGVVWIATSRGISAFSGTAWQNFDSDNSPLPRDVVSAVVIDPAGNRWFATEGGGIGRLSADGTEWRTYTQADGLGDDFVLDLAVDLDGRVWAGTWRGGLSVLDGDRWLTYQTTNSGLAADWVQSLAVDGQGRIWCGTYGLPGGGISVLTPMTGQWVQYGPADGVPSDNVTTLAATRPGEMWVGTDRGGIRYLEPLLLLGSPETEPGSPTPTPAPTEPPWFGQIAAGRGGGEQVLGNEDLLETPWQVTPTPTPWTTPIWNSPTPTPSRMPSPTPPPSATPTTTPVPSPTPSPSGVPTATPTSTPTPTPTASVSPSPSSSPTRTHTPSPTATRTPSPTATAGTPTIIAGTRTPTPSTSPTRTPSPSPTPTAGACMPICTPRPGPPPPPPPLPTKESERVHTFTTSWGVVRINERPSDNALRVPLTKGVGGRAVRVYVNADTLVWVAGVQLEFRYDTAMLTAVGVNRTPRSEVMSRGGPVIDQENGEIRTLLFSPEGEAIPPGRGPILSLLFEVREGATDNQRALIQIERAILSDIDGNEVEVPAHYIFDGYLVICSECFLHNGDVDKDGDVTILDVQRGINIVLGWHIADDEEVVALDINGDGSADVLDVIKLVNLAVGQEAPPPWQPTPTPLPTTPVFTQTPTATPGSPVPTTPVFTRTPTPASPVPTTPGLTPTTTPTVPATTASPTPGTPAPTETPLPTPTGTAYPTPSPTMLPSPTLSPRPSPSPTPEP